MTLIEYLSAKGYSVSRIGKDQYQGLPDETGTPHDSFVYDESSDKWMWPERAKSGFGLEDYLKKILGIREEDIESHLDEMSNLTEGNVIPAEVVTHEKHRILTPAESSDDEFFNLPPRAVSTHAIDKYYIHTMSISPSVISWFESQGLLYESNEQYQLKDRRVYYHNAIFVCVNTDEDGEFVASGAVRKYLRPDKEGVLRTNLVSRSDANVGFSRITPQCQGLLVFESIIEMLSYFTLIEMQGRSFKNQPFVCLDGVKISETTLPKPLFTVIKAHPQIRAVFFAAGKSFEKQASFLKDKIIEKKRKSGVILSECSSFSEELLKKCPPNVSLDRYVKQYRTSEASESI